MARTVKASRIQRAGFVVAAALCVGSVCFAAAWSMPSARVKTRAQPLSEADVLNYVARLGIDGQVAAIAGLTTTQLEGVITLGEEHFAEAGLELRLADELVASTKQALNAAESGIARGATGVNGETLSTARSQHAAALASRDALVQSGFTAATTSLSGTQITLLQRLIGNRKWDLPAEFRVLDLTSAQWAAARKTYYAKVARDQHAATNPEMQVAAFSSDTWTTMNTHADVIAARSALANAPALDAIWQQAFSSVEPQ